MSNDDRRQRDDEAETTLPILADGADPHRLGPYRLLRRVGEGGMGEVYEAEQLEPVRRRVAIKLIKHGMDTKQVVARFEAERQALAMMNHPCVAQVFDAGTTPSGAPYFAMEFVAGVPITEFCDRRQMTNRARLELMLQVCAGVQHAHHNAIIHRDLKPSNLLVTEEGGRPVPKIIDFGVAKATGPQLTERTMFTELGVMVGTPEYMSPEQADMSGLHVDTRTDVYALGVILYELLVGALPFDPRALREAGFDGIRRKLQEEEPPRPSTRLSTLGEASLESAKRRQVDLPTLRRELRGDLDWIAMKALEKERGRRYGSPREFAADIERYLADEAVSASPPTLRYRAGKFVRRHRLAVGMSAAGLAVLIAFAASMAAQTRRIARERDRANLETQAKVEVLRFLQDLFKVSDPARAQGRSVTARELLDRGAARVDDTLADQPAIQAELMDTMGRVYGNLGLYKEALPLLEQATEQRRQHFGDDAPATLASLGHLGSLYMDLGRLTEAEAVHRQVLDAQRRLQGDQALESVTAMNRLANTLLQRGEHDEAESLYRQVLQRRLEQLGPEHEETLGTKNNLAIVLARRGLFHEAELLHLEVVEVQRASLGELHPNTLSAISNLANLYVRQRRDQEAEALVRQMLQARREVLGAEHPDTLQAQGNLAHVLSRSGRIAEAEPLLQRTLEGQRNALGPDHVATLNTAGNLATLYRRTRRYGEAELLQLETVERQRNALGDDHPYTLASAMDLGNLYLSLERFGEAEAIYADTLERRRRTLGERHPSTLASMNNLGALYWHLERYAETEPLWEAVIEGRRALLGPDHFDTLRAMRNLAQLYTAMQLPNLAEPLLIDVADRQRRTLGPDHSELRRTLVRLANLYRRGDRNEEARGVMQEILAMAHRAATEEEAEAGDHDRLASLLLSATPEDLRDPALALVHARRAVELSDGMHPTFLENLARAHHFLGQRDEAVAAQRRALEQIESDDPKRAEAEQRLVAFKAGL